MTAPEPDELLDKITEGVKLAIRCLIERTKKEDGDLVISRDGKRVRIKARDSKNRLNLSFYSGNFIHSLIV